MENLVTLSLMHHVQEVPERWWTASWKERSLTSTWGATAPGWPRSAAVVDGESCISWCVFELNVFNKQLHFWVKCFWISCSLLSNLMIRQSYISSTLFFLIRSPFRPKLCLLEWNYWVRHWAIPCSIWCRSFPVQRKTRSIYYSTLHYHYSSW